VIEAMVSADLMVADVDAVVRRLVDALGLPEPRPAWTHEHPGYTYKAVFCRVHPTLRVAPTLIEVIAPAPAEGEPPRDIPPVDQNMAAYARAQGNRPVLTHATVFASSAFDEVRQRLQREGIRHRVEPPTPELPFDRLWIGTTPDDPFGYDASCDGGLFVEVVPLPALHLPAAAPIEDPRPGTMVRVVSRRFLVPDLDATLAALRRALGWPGDVDVVDAPDGRSVLLQPALLHSAALHLVQPVSGRLADFAAAHGHGAHAIRIGVVGLGAKLDDLRRRDTGWTSLSDGAVEVDPAALDGAVVELAELDA
jgi:hypothetical protein